MSDSGEITPSFEWPAYAYRDWKWCPMNGWVNPDDDPATPTEAALLNELRALLGTGER